MLHHIKQFSRFLPQRHHVRAAALSVLGALALFYAYQCIALWRGARAITAAAPKLEAALVARDIGAARETLLKAQQDMESLHRTVRRLYPFEMRSTKRVLAAGSIMLESGLRITEWLGSIPLIQKEGVSSYGDFTDEDKRLFLASLAESEGLWREARERAELALLLLAAAQKETRLPIASNLIRSSADKLTRVLEIVRAAEPWLAAAPELLGYPEPKTYLLLLQNNTELRPTGGFIGTFGVVTLSHGSIARFETENVYNLDEPAKSYNEKIPPEPIRRYLKQSQWFFRDANWDPDFPSTAARAIQFYKDERGPVARFDGVIAFTPQLIEDLLSVAGPVTVGDVAFTPENLVDTLAYHVELGFREEGITPENRKQVIDELARELKERLFSLDAAQIRLFLPKAAASFKEKHLMLYFTDSSIQSAVQAAGWDNRIRETEGDYLYVVDANLGSLKSDPAIERTIAYTLAPAGNGALRATAAITYNHTAGFDWKTTRYRTYTRVYVPLGAKLVTAAGNEERVVIGDEHGKTVFGTFISIEPNTSETLSFTYELPSPLAARMEERGYTLLVQKQGGAAAHMLEFDIILPSGSRFAKKWDLGEDRVVDAGAF